MIYVTKCNYVAWLIDVILPKISFISYIILPLKIVVTNISIQTNKEVNNDRYNIETVKEMYTYIKNKYYRNHVQMHF